MRWLHIIKFALLVHKIEIRNIRIMQANIKSIYILNYILHCTKEFLSIQYLLVNSSLQYL